MSTGFQLRRVSGGNLLPLTNGSVIGRGELFQVDDKRVSRQHAEFEITDNKLFLKPLHSNPCFLQCNSGSGHLTLTKGERRHLEHDDIFSLLPDALHYQVVQDKPVDSIDLDMTVEEIKDSKQDDTEDKEAKDEEEINESKEETKEEENEITSNDKEKEEESKEGDEGGNQDDEEKEDVALPSDKPRTLPDWMVGSANKNTEEEETANGNEVKPVKTKKEAPKAKKRGRPKLEENKKKKKKKLSESEDEVSDEEAHRPTRRRLRADSNDDTEEEPISVRRPSRRASQNKQYSDEFLVSDEEEIVESEEDTRRKVKRDEDSDFIAEEPDSGSDWEATSKSPPKGRVRGSPGKRSGRGRPRGRKSSNISESDDVAPKRGRGRPRKTSGDVINETPPRRAKKAKVIDSEGDDDIEEEEYVPRPSKRRGASDDAPSGDVLREPCQFGEECYRKGATHRRQFSHPGDSDHEDNEDNSDLPECEYGIDCYRKNPQHRKEYKHTTKARPQRNVANVQVTTLIDSEDEEFADDVSDAAANDGGDSDWSPGEEDTSKKPVRGKRKGIQS